MRSRELMNSPVESTGPVVKAAIHQRDSQGLIWYRRFHCSSSTEDLPRRCLGLAEIEGPATASRYLTIVKGAGDVRLVQINRQGVVAGLESGIGVAANDLHRAGRSVATYVRQAPSSRHVLSKFIVVVLASHVLDAALRIV